MSGSASLGQCVRRKRSIVSTPRSWDSHSGLHFSTADSAPIYLCLKSASAKIPFLYLGFLNILPSTSAVWKYVSASPSHPGEREERSPAPPVIYSRESCSLSASDSSPLCYHPCTCRKTENMYQCEMYNKTGCTDSNVSRSPTVRVVDVCVLKVKSDDKLSFPHHKGHTFVETKVVARCYPRPCHKDKKLNMSHNYRECTNSRHVKSDGCAQDVQSMYVYSGRRHVQYHHEGVPPHSSPLHMMFVVY